MEQQKKKIVIFINNLNYGGAQKIASILLIKLQQYFDLHLLLIHNKDEIAYEIPENINISILESKYKGVFAKIDLIFKFKSFCKKNDIDVSLSLLTQPNYISILSKLIGNKSKIIISEHTFQSLWRSNELLYSKFKKLIISILYNYSDKIVTVSKKINEDLKTNFKVKPEKLITIYNPYEIEKINQLSKEDTSEPNLKPSTKFRLAIVGTLYHVKNHELLIKALKRIERLNFELVIIGDGELRTHLEDLTNTLNLQGKILFLGFQSNPFKYLGASDVLILSSNNEGLPNVIIEGLACDCVIVSTDCTSGPREILAPETNINFQLQDTIEHAKYGLLVPVKNEELLAKAIEKIILDTKLFSDYKKTSYARSLNFDSKISIEKYTNLIDNIC